MADLLNENTAEFEAMSWRERYVALKAAAEARPSSTSTAVAVSLRFSEQNQAEVREAAREVVAYLNRESRIRKQSRPAALDNARRILAALTLPPQASDEPAQGSSGVRDHG